LDLKNNNNEFAAYFYNLDDIILKNQNKYKDAYEISIKIGQSIKNYATMRSIVHTNVINNKIALLFKNQNILYIEKTFIKGKKDIIHNIITLYYSLFDNTNRPLRSFLRINLFPQRLHKIEIINLSNNNYSTNGYLKDMSLNGVGCILFDKKDLDFFKIKDEIQIKLFMPKCIIKILSASVARIKTDEKELLIGAFFNINDKKIIKKNSANNLTKIVYDYIKEIMRNFYS
ncbi:MAG: PilZ domain-containing protein, partial [Spirochaetes bacterium]|nr:PilZ domain-containing protein [Spirochaetota bacterium]